jgi:low affinity Fe/Cu permease
MKTPKAFHRFATVVTNAAGSVWAFLGAVLVITVWLASGPIFGFSDTWQLVINTGTTIVTFLMVFVIQHSQNREVKAIQLKLDELIASVDGASNSLIDIEEVSDDELERLNVRFRCLASRVRAARGRRRRAKTSIEREAEHEARVSRRGRGRARTARPAKKTHTSA